MSRTLAITNQKGGVGKTTTATHLAHALARSGRRVLLVDADGQGHCAVFLGVPRGPGLSGLLTRTQHDTTDPGRAFAPAADFVTRDVRPGLDLITCDPSIAHAEARIQGEAMRELRMARRLAEVRAEYDDVLIDVGPKTDLLSTMALLAADDALIVTLPSTPAESLRDVTRRLRTLREEAGRGPAVAGVMLAQVDTREGPSRQASADLAASGVQAPGIPKSVDIARATASGKTIFELQPDGRGAQAYAALAEWWLQRQGAPV